MRPLVLPSCALCSLWLLYQYGQGGMNLHSILMFLLAVCLVADWSACSLCGPLLLTCFKKCAAVDDICLHFSLTWPESYSFAYIFLKSANSPSVFRALINLTFWGSGWLSFFVLISDRWSTWLPLIGVTVAGKKLCWLAEAMLPSLFRILGAECLC